MNNQRNFENQFASRRPYTIPAFMREKPWSDECWGNDVSPKFYNNDLDLCVFVDADDVERRECDSYKRFTVIAIIWGDKEAREDDTLADGVLFETESEQELITFLSNYKPQ